MDATSVKNEKNEAELVEISERSERKVPQTPKSSKKRSSKSRRSSSESPRRKSKSKGKDESLSPAKSSKRKSPRKSKNSYKEQYEKSRKAERTLKEKNRLLAEMNQNQQAKIRKLQERLLELAAPKQHQLCEQTLQDIVDLVFQHAKDSKLRELVSAKLDAYEQGSRGSRPDMVMIGESSDSSSSSLMKGAEERIVNV